MSRSLPARTSQDRTRRVACADHRSNATGVSDSSLGVAAGDPRKTPKTDSDTNGVAETSGTPLAFESCGRSEPRVA